MSPVTEDAIKTVNEVRSAGPLYDKDYVEKLPPHAMLLARVVAKDDVAKARERYHVADQRADRAQARFVLMGRVTAYSAFLSAVLGGVLLYIGSAQETETWFLAVGMAQFALLVISLLGSMALYTLKPFRTWRQQRGEAEAERIGLFARVMSDPGQPGDDERQLLALQLECFRRYLLDDQLDYFRRRGPEHRRAVRRAQILRGVALFLIVVAALPLLVKLAPVTSLPDWVRALLAWLPLEGQGVAEMYALGGLVGGVLQGLLAALAVISLSERNAGKFERMAGRLDDYSKTRLPVARAAVADGNALLVGEFARQVASDLAAEASEWVAVQEALSSITLERLTVSHSSGV